MTDRHTKTDARSHEPEKAREGQRPREAALEPMNELGGEAAVFESLLATPAMGLPVERHAATLNDARFSHPANAPHKARMVSQLQRQYGNGYVQRVLETVMVQASPQADSYDGCQQREANDRLNASVQTSDLAVQRQIEERKEVERALQTEPTTAPRPQAIQRWAEEGEEEEEAPLQTAPAWTQAPPVSNTLEARISAARDSGQPLDDSVRASLELQLGIGLDSVRVHADGDANQLSRNLNAKAFTTEKDVFFRAGYYQPGSSEGKQLLAHELTHVVQQNGTPRIQRQEAPPRGRRRYRLVANLGAAQLTVFHGKDKVREMPVIFGRATSTLLKYRQLRIGHWREGFTTPSRTDYTACTWFKWGKELDRFPRVAAGPTGTAGTGTIKVRGRRYKVGTIVPGKKGEIYRHESDWLKWETIEQYCNPFGKYATVIRGNFMLHGTDGADGLGGPFAGLTPAQRAKVTHGCIRTSNADIEWLKGNVPARTTIRVLR